jgi:hypothetical protein
MGMGSAAAERRVLSDWGVSANAFHEKALSLRTASVRARSPLPIVFLVFVKHPGNETGLRSEDW